MRGELYQLIFPNGKSYIGITSRSVGERVKGHIKASRSLRSKTALSKAIRKHGENFERKALVIGKMDYLKELEVKAIKAFGTLCPNGYNLSFGGDISPMHNPEVAAKISESMKLNNPMANPVHLSTMRNAISTKEYKEKQKAKAISQWADVDSKLRKAIEGENNPMKRPEVVIKSIATRRAKGLLGKGGHYKRTDEIKLKNSISQKERIKRSKCDSIKN